MAPGPRYRKCTLALWRGPGGMPLALRLSEGLGHAGLCMNMLFARQWDTRLFHCVEDG